MAVNTAWADHCNKLKEDENHKREEIDSLRRHIMEREESEVKRQREIDQMILASKKKTEDEEARENVFPLSVFSRNTRKSNWQK